MSAAQATGTPQSELLAIDAQMRREGAEARAEATYPADPKLSIVVIVYKMSRQAENTLYSLSPAYQHGVTADDYEVVVVENESADPLGAERALAHGPNYRYYARPNIGASPVPGIIFGVEATRAPILGLVIDGARMVTRGSCATRWTHSASPTTQWSMSPDITSEPTSNIRIRRTTKPPSSRCSTRCGGTRMATGCS